MTTHKPDIKSEILRILDEKKMIDIEELDTSSLNSRMSDYLIIASGTSSVHMQSVADFLYRFLKSEMRLKAHIEGTARNGWILLAVKGIEVHFFKPELRGYYDIKSILTNGSHPSTLEEFYEINCKF